MAVMALGMTTATYAQAPVQVQTITAGGDYNNGGTTVLKDWKLADMPLRTTADSIVLTTKDTLKTTLKGIYNSVTFQFTVDSLGGRVDSFTITVQGSIDTGRGIDFATLQTFTCGNSAKNVFSYVVNTRGNPYTNYRHLFATTNKAAGSQARWKSKMLVRYKEPEVWEDFDAAWLAAEDSKQIY